MQKAPVSLLKAGLRLQDEVLLDNCALRAMRAMRELVFHRHAKGRECLSIVRRLDFTIRLGYPVLLQVLSVRTYYMWLALWERNVGLKVWLVESDAERCILLGKGAVLVTPGIAERLEANVRVGLEVAGADEDIGIT